MPHVMERRDLSIGEGTAQVWTGGQGDGVPLVLLHGAWAGAAPHWSGIWDRLAAERRVVAPELPGLGAPSTDPPGTVAAYAEWVLRVMDATAVDRAVVVGNSFGASIAWCAAATAPARVAAVVLVDGAPGPGLPMWLRRALAAPPLRRALTAMFRRNVYSHSTAARAFADARNVPPEVDAVLHDPHPAPLDVVTEVVLASEPCPAPTTRDVLLLWGDADRLSGSSVRAAQRLQRRIAGSQLVVVSGAGHLPQVEQPDAVVTALTRFVDRVDGPRSDRPPDAPT